MKYLLFVVAFYLTGTRAFSQAADSMLHKTTKKAIAPHPTIADVKELKRDSTYLLSNITFQPDRHEFRPGCDGDTYVLYQRLMDNPRLKIMIEGHVCCISAEATDALDVGTNEPSLSVNRAKEIYKCLIDRGIDSSRIKYAGLGKHKPIIPDERTEEEAAINRRVEIRVLEN